MTRLPTERVRALRAEMQTWRCTWCGALNPPSAEVHGHRHHVGCTDAEFLTSGAGHASVVRVSDGVSPDELVNLLDDLLDAREELARQAGELADTRADVLVRDQELAAADRVFDGLRAELARLRAIVEGRTTAPTDAEIAAHDAACGRWVLDTPDWTDVPSGEAERRYADHHRDRPALGWRWLPLDRDGRPCAWPAPDAADAARREG